MKLINWVKNNKLVTLLLVIIVFLALRNVKTPTMYSISSAVPGAGIGGFAGKSAGLDSFSGSTRSIALPNPVYEAAPQPEVADRMVIQESDISLLVKNVIDTRNKILAYTKQSGGYMISANTSNPQDAPTATVAVRIPSDKLEATLDYFHTLAVKVVSENLSGYDVTDQYVDVEKRIGYLQATIIQYQSILSQSREISDITNLTERIISTQQQIDSLKGQQEGMSQRAKTARLTIYLSTDEMALPYAPSETWRPAVIFKQAVRAMVSDLRKIGTFLIWLGVYAVIWIPLLIIVVFIKRRFFGNKTA
jgi:hypothetical protein